jgi:hypothetical protein
MAWSRIACGVSGPFSQTRRVALVLDGGASNPVASPLLALLALSSSSDPQAASRVLKKLLRVLAIDRGVR